jgi:hypothetical protein
MKQTETDFTNLCSLAKSIPGISPAKKWTAPSAPYHPDSLKSFSVSCDISFLNYFNLCKVFIYAAENLLKPRQNYFNLGKRIILSDFIEEKVLDPDLHGSAVPHVVSTYLN